MNSLARWVRRDTGDTVYDQLPHVADTASSSSSSSSSSCLDVQIVTFFFSSSLHPL